MVEGREPGTHQFGEGASCSIPLVLNHIQGKMILSNSSWRDGRLAFMEINTSTSKTGTPSSVRSCPTICRLRVSSFFAVSPPPQKLQPPTPFSAKNKLHPGPALQGLGTWVPSIHLLLTWPMCVLQSQGHCVLLGSWPCAFSFPRGVFRTPLTLEVLSVMSSLQPKRSQGKLFKPTQASMVLKTRGYSSPVSKAAWEE